ncbi:hypothetical protein P152DRAFT_111857 [Eremomyces bilateralis CBS 781.70]|uniref:Uncharacterized protein n=1 Tax=Eremomyces bilateralis CBS 781.70 TaxID=1392243 RepID=A0A6G1GDM9_9PEZI|nr:uncharacterized protein P152DRAFT_111857 [Eremomyces bilateralis CBS 781.70]KAF1816148.1 hypothetical protein P152DRAFT_111857 [Eremomyces bilateralis CBS 781.70]
MSSSIQIPQRKSTRPPSIPVTQPGASSSSGSSSDFSLSSSAGGSPYRGSHQRTPSFLSAAFSKAEHTVVNVGHPDAPRLITCVKASQGFDWNQGPPHSTPLATTTLTRPPTVDIFLPSYAERDSTELEHKQDPVTDIILTDEEAASYLPS